MAYEFDGRFPDGGQKTLNSKKLRYFAEAIGLTRCAADRFSWLFVFKIYALARVNGLAPQFVLDQVKALEGAADHRGVKTATKFKHPPLKGLHHQHFFAPQFMAQNMRINLKQWGRACRDGCDIEVWQSNLN